MDDYSYWDPPLWLGVFALYIFPICYCFYQCRKNKRKLFPSFLMAIYYPSSFWVVFLLWVGGLVFALQIFEEITFIPNVVGVIISFFVVGGGLLFPLGYLQNLSGTFYENYKEKGVFSFKNIKKD